MFRVALRLHRQGLATEAISAAVHAQNAAQCVPPLDANEIDAIIRSAITYPGVENEPPSDLGNARRLVAQINGNARYEHSLRAWFVWNEKHWERDDGGAIMQFAKRTADNLLASAKAVEEPDVRKRQVAFALKTQGSARLSAMVELAQSEPGVSVQFANFDRQLHLLNVRNGTLDLKTGQLLPHERDHMISQLIDIPYDRDAKCPNFERFMDEVFPSDPALVAYMQRVIGYAATGDTREQAFWILHGDGSNGKSTLLNVIGDALGSYSKHTPTETLISKTGGASNDLARLAGARFVTASEANADQRLAESLVKQITGDEPVTARFLYREFITFRPQMKLFLATNQLPQLSGTDPAMWRRIRLVPFNRVFSAEEQDRSLRDKLTAELPGILAWIVRGAVDWYANGLQLPASVRSAGSEYQQDMDSVGAFLDDRCEVSPTGSIGSSTLFNEYRHYSNEAGRSPLNQATFGRTLTKRGYPAEKRAGHKQRVGLTLKRMVA